MKLLISKVGETGETEIIINNARAAVSNMRAVIAIKLKLDARGFTMSHNGSTLTAEHVLLSDAGIKDGDTITITTNRPRESAASATGAGESQRNSATAAAAVVVGTDNAAAPAAAAAGGAAQEQQQQGGVEEEDADWRTVDEEFEHEEDDDLSTDTEAEEVDRMFELVQALPNRDDLRQRFIANPEEGMRAIQTAQPELFALINKHPQAFLDIVNGDYDPTGAHMLPFDLGDMDEEGFENFLMQLGEDEEGDDSDDDDDDEDESSSSDDDGHGDEGGAGRRVVATTTRRRRGGGAATGGVGGRGVAANRRPAAGNAANAVDGAGGAAAAAPAGGASRRRGRAAAGSGRGGAAAGGIGNNAAAQIAASDTRPITDEDRENIMRIVELGFSQEQAQRAYLICGRNADRAAAWLFEHAGAQ